MTSVSKSCFAFVFAGLMTVSSGAQTVSQSYGIAGMEDGKTMKALTIPVPPTCPVAMSAQHGWGGGMVAVKGEEHSGIGQRIELTLNNPGSEAISEIRITIHGWGGNGHTLPARSVNSNYANASQSLELKISIAPHKATKSDLWVSRLTSVQSINLVSVKYAKGLSWRAPAPQACRIVPDPEMLIGHR